MSEIKQPMNLASANRIVRLGFVPLTDCAPLVMAQELGLFKKYGLRVALSRELGWATIRDKVIHGELDEEEIDGAFAEDVFAEARRIAQ